MYGRHFAGVRRHGMPGQVRHDVMVDRHDVRKGRHDRDEHDGDEHDAKGDDLPGHPLDCMQFVRITCCCHDEDGGLHGLRHDEGDGLRDHCRDPVRLPGHLLPQGLQE